MAFAWFVLGPRAHRGDQHRSDLLDRRGGAVTGLVDPRLAFLARAGARFILVETGEMDLDEADDDLIWSVCDCQRWPLAEQWERTHPPRELSGWRR